MGSTPAWFELVLELGQARGEGVAIKDADGRVVATNGIWDDSYGPRSRRRFPKEFVSAPVAQVAATTDGWIRERGEPLQLYVPSPKGWHLSTKFVFREHIVLTILWISRRRVRDRMLESYPALSRSAANFLTEALIHAAADPAGEIHLNELSTPRSSAGRYLRQLEGLSLIRRERSGRGLRLYPAPGVFMPSWTPAQALTPPS